MKSLTALFSAGGLVALAAFYTSHAQAFADDKSEISAIEQRIAEGVKAKDVDKIMSCYSPDETLLIFDVIPPRQYVGAKAYRKDWVDLFAQFPGPAEADISDIGVAADRTLGYAHLITHSVFTDKDGNKVSANVRTTDVFKKTGGKWLIVHEHNSIPVDLASGKGDMLAKP